MIYFKPCPECGASMGGINTFATAEFDPERETIIYVQCMECGCHKKFRVSEKTPINTQLIADMWNNWVQAHTAYNVKPMEVGE